MGAGSQIDLWMLSSEPTEGAADILSCIFWAYWSPSAAADSSLCLLSSMSFFFHA